MSQITRLVSGGVSSITAGTNLNDSGTATDPILNLDDSINLTSIDVTNLTVSGLTRGIVQSSAAGVISSSEGTDGQMLVSSSSGAAAFSNITSTGGFLDITNGPNTVDIGINSNAEVAAVHGWNGSIIESPTVSVASDGTTITFSVEKSGGGDLTVVFSDGFYSWDTTPAATIALTAGSDTSPQLNYVYLLQSTKTLTVSTAGWPTTEHAPLATISCQSALSLQSQGAMKVHAWTDHVVSSNNSGHIGHVNYWIRTQPATWENGVAQNLTITTNAAVPDNVIFTSASGTVLQLHDHVFPAFAGTPVLYTVNDSVAAYNKITDLNELLTDSLGVSMSGRYFSLVIWGIVSESTGDCKLMVNLPDCSYGTQAQLESDAQECVDYSIPSDFRGTGFLIAKLDLRHQTLSGGTWTEIDVIDLRGQFPSTTAGGASTVTSEFVDNAFKIYDDGDNTKQLAFQVSGVTTATTRTITMCDADLDLTSPSFGGSVTAATGMTITANDLDIISGSINLPTTSATAGQITINSINALHMYGTDNFFANAAGNFTLTGSNNIGIGASSLDSLTSGSKNVAIGYNALTSSSTGSNSVAIGYEAGKENPYSGVVFIGAESGRSTNAGDSCTAVGYQSHSLNDGDKNTCIGFGSLNVNSTGGYNVAAGYNAGKDYAVSSSISIGAYTSASSDNTIKIGTQGTGNGQQDKAFIAGIYNTTPTGGNGGIVITDSNGQLGSTLTPTVTSLTTTGTVTAATGMTITANDLDIISGSINLPTTTATDGQITVNSNRFIHSYGTSNLFIGENGGNFALTGTGNIGIGKSSLDVLGTGYSNAAIGLDTMGAITTGYENVAIGRDAMKATSSGSIFNVAIGAYSMDASTTGGGATFIGYKSGRVASGNNNSGFGLEVLTKCTSGQANTAVGTRCLNAVTTGSFNVGIGHGAASPYGGGSNYTTSESSNICIQNYGTAGDNNTIRIGTQGTGSGQQDTTFIAGIYNTTPTGGNDGTVIIDSNGQLGSTTAVTGSLALNNQTGTTYTTILSDQNTYVTLTNAAAIAVTIPTNASVSYPIGAQIYFSQGGAGAATFSGAGVTINSRGTLTSTNGQYAEVKLTKTATDVWVLSGDRV